MSTPRLAFPILSLLLASILIAPATVVRAGVRDDHPNLIGGEIMGRGFALTLNYERFLTNQFGLGAGFMMIGTSDGMVSVLPLYASFLTGNEHSLYLSAGGAYVGGGSFQDDYENSWVTQASIGYHFQSRGGFFVRPLFTFNYAILADGNSDFLIWPGVTIGGSF